MSSEIAAQKRSKRKGNLAVSSLVISLIGFVVSSIDLYFCVSSFLTTKGVQTIGDAIGTTIGTFFMMILFILCAVVGGALSLLSLCLGIGALANNDSTFNKKTVAASGVLFSVFSIVMIVVCFVVRSLVSNVA